MQQQFTVLLNSLQTCTAGLLQCLEDERTALAARNMDQVEQVTQRKIDLTRELEQLEQQRATLVTDLGYSNDLDGMAHCMGSQPNRQQLELLWRQVLDNLQACRDGNLTNGGILELGRKQVEQALTILRGQQNATRLYDPEGGSRPTFGNRELGKA